MRLIYDQTTKCLASYREDVSDLFWDNHWVDTDISSLYKSLSRYNLIIRITKKYLKPQDGPILEGGCGVGQFVYSLYRAGYDCRGVDTAENTIGKIKSSYPALNVNVMDVRKLDFPDNYFAGYWSLGVIEHFFEDYDEILNEMYRVVKPGGYIFLTVPIMSLLRQLKAFLGLYETLPAILCKDNFYQFIFPHEKIINDFINKGLILLKTKNKGGIKGLRDEVTIFKAPLQYIAQQSNKNIVFKSFVRLLDMTLSPVVGHMCLFVFKKA